MNKKYSIGLFVGLLIFIYMLAALYQISYNQAEKKRENEQRIANEQAIKTKGSAYKEQGFVILEENGLVYVYYSDFSEVYEYTSIKTKDLPEDIYKKVSTGFYVNDEAAVYRFLENYSS